MTDYGGGARLHGIKVKAVVYSFFTVCKICGTYHVTDDWFFTVIDDHCCDSHFISVGEI